MTHVSYGSPFLVGQIAVCFSAYDIEVSPRNWQMSGLILDKSVHLSIYFFFFLFTSSLKRSGGSRGAVENRKDVMLRSRNWAQAEFQPQMIIEY